MSIKVLTEAWEIENKIKNMNKKELQEFMLGYLKNEVKERIEKLFEEEN